LNDRSSRSEQATLHESPRASAGGSTPMAGTCAAAG
jgi:hypothetical protein